MQRTAQNISCPGCIEQTVTVPEHSDCTELCASCITDWKPPDSRISPHSYGGTAGQEPQGSQLLHRIHTMAAQVDIASTATSPTRANDIANLESWSRAMVDAINDRDFTNPLFGFASPNFEAGVIDVFPPTDTPAAHLDKFRKMAEESPEYHMQLDDISTDMDPGGEYAKVYLTIRATGRPPGLTREALGVLTWRKQEGVWCLISHESMRTFVV